MKSLSPNAQEFVPLNGAILNQALNQITGVQTTNSTMTVYLMNANDVNNTPGANTNTQFNNYLHSHPNQFRYPNNYAFQFNKQVNSPGVQSPIAANQPQLNINHQYPIYINPEYVGSMSPSQPASTPSQQPTLNLISHSPIALQMQPIPPAQQVQYATQILTRATNPGMYQTVQQISPQHLTVPYQAQNFNYQQANAPSVQVTPIPLHPPPFATDNHFAGYNNYAYQMSSQVTMHNNKPQKFSNKQKQQHNFVQPNTQNKNNSYNKKYNLQINQQNKTKLNSNLVKQNGFEINNEDEKDWPKLAPSAQLLKINNNDNNNNNNSNRQKLNKKNSKEEEEDEDDDNEIKNTQKEKEEVRKPFLDDPKKLRMVLNNVNFIKTTLEKHYNESNLENMKKNNKVFSFREAVMAKPTPPSTLPKPVEAKKSQENLNTENKTIQDNLSSSKARRKSKSRRSRSKKNKSDDDKAASRDSSNDNNFHKTFDLNEQEFPDLNSVNVPAKHKNLSSFEDKSSFQSDAYSSDVTLESSLRSKSNPQIDAKKKASNPQASGKKSHQPITLDFANMISALEKGQQRSSTNKLRSKSQNSSINGLTALSSLKKNNQVVNPLDSTQTLKRGKERERPKAKKQSTLKKIILKEREEKRRNKLDQIKSSELAIDMLGLNSPIASAAVSTDLILSPRNQSQLTQINLKNLELELNLDKNQLISETSNENEKKTNEVADIEVKPYNEEDNESIKTCTLKENEKNDENLNKIKKISENHNENNEEESENDDDADDDDNEDENNNVDVMSNQMSPISQGSPISINSYSPNPYAALNMMSNDRSLLSLEKLEEQVKQKIHSRKFREYCNQIINRDIDEICSSLLHEIVRFQDRLYHKNPVKAKMKRRYVMGIREVTKHLKLQKLKCVILAPNCEKIQSKGGLDDAINFIIQSSMEQNVPFVFALGRKGLGKAVNKLVPISVVGIFDYSGAEDYFKRLVELANNAKLAYQEMVEEYEKEECENLITMQKLAANKIPTDDNLKDNLISAQSVGSSTVGVIYQPKLPSHMAHSRTPSNGSNISIEPYFMNYHTHSRSASGNFNYGHTTGAAVSGHSRSASGGGGGTLNIDLNLHGSNKHWTHSRTPSNCSNISFISRLSEPISEVGGSVGTLFLGSTNNSTNNLAYFVGGSASTNPTSNTLNSAFAAVQYYTEQVRQEMRETESLSSNNQPSKDQNTNETEDSTQQATNNNNNQNINAISSSLVNLHLGCINEIDAGNEADTEEYELNRGKSKLKTIKSKQNSIDNETNNQPMQDFITEEANSSEKNERKLSNEESKTVNNDKNE